MNRCPITYEKCGAELYTLKGLRALSPVLRSLYALELSTEELQIAAWQRAAFMPLPGSQPKLGAVLNVREKRFEMSGLHSRFILKPQHPVFTELPQNEDLTMRLAASVGIDVPLHGMVYASDGSLVYFIKRFDRNGEKNKFAVEDFGQLAGLRRADRYRFHMEGVAGIIKHHCSNPARDLEQLFLRVLFNYLVGNEDMHVKNYSLITRRDEVRLSPAYDLVNTTIAVPRVEEEIALSLRGMKTGLTREALVEYLGGDVCRLPTRVVHDTLRTLQLTVPLWFGIIDRSFLSEGRRLKYKALIQARKRVLWG
ncbi:MAG: HipA domain-containing protein [Bacteroidales bacterium]